MSKQWLSFLQLFEEKNPHVNKSDLLEKAKVSYMKLKELYRTKKNEESTGGGKKSKKGKKSSSYINPASFTHISNRPRAHTPNGLRGKSSVSINKEDYLTGPKPNKDDRNDPPRPSSPKPARGKSSASNNSFTLDRANSSGSNTAASASSSSSSTPSRVNSNESNSFTPGRENSSDSIPPALRLSRSNSSGSNTAASASSSSSSTPGRVNSSKESSLNNRNSATTNAASASASASASANNNSSKSSNSRLTRALKYFRNAFSCRSAENGAKAAKREAPECKLYTDEEILEWVEKHRGNPAAVSLGLMSAQNMNAEEAPIHKWRQAEAIRKREEAKLKAIEEELKQLELAEEARQLKMAKNAVENKRKADQHAASQRAFVDWKRLRLAPYTGRTLREIVENNKRAIAEREIRAQELKDAAEQAKLIAAHHEQVRQLQLKADEADEADAQEQLKRLLAVEAQLEASAASAASAAQSLTPKLAPRSETKSSAAAQSSKRKVSSRPPASSHHQHDFVPAPQFIQPQFIQPQFVHPAPLHAASASAAGPSVPNSKPPGSAANAKKKVCPTTAEQRAKEQRYEPKYGKYKYCPDDSNQKRFCLPGNPLPVLGVGMMDPCTIVNDTLLGLPPYHSDPAVRSLKVYV